MRTIDRLRYTFRARQAGLDGALIRLIVLGVWGATIGTLFLWAATETQVRAAVADDVQLGVVAQTVRLISFVSAAGVCVVALLMRWRDRRMTDLLRVALCLLPWGYLVMRGLYEGTAPDGTSLIYPLLVVAIWSLRPSRDVLEFLGLVVTATLLMAAVLAVLNPSAGLQLSYTGEVLQADKALLPFGLLAGMFTTANNLGQFAALGLPLTFAIKNVPLRVVAVGITIIALVWSSSRASWIAAAVSLTVMAAIAVHRARARTALAALCLFGSAAVVIATPLLTDDPSAFSGRGRIWAQSLAYLDEDLAFGLGPRWYQTIGEVSNSLGTDAFHGHNQFIQILVTGGVVYLATTAALFVLLWRAIHQDIRNSVVPVGYLVSLVAMSLLEVTVGFVDRTNFWVVAVVPCLLLLFARSTAVPGGVGPACRTPADTNR